MTQEQKDELESVQDADQVTWFNRTKVSDKAAATVKTIPGAFYKAREAGAASIADSEEMNKFYKRSLVTCFVLLAHSYAFIHFAYESRIVSRVRTPTLHKRLPYALYPGVLFGLCVFVIRKNWQIQERLDSKYTPIWLRVS